MQLLFLLLPLYQVFLPLTSGSESWNHNSDDLIQNRHFQGRYTGDINDYEVTIPRKVNEDGTFRSFSLPHFYQRNRDERRERRDDEAGDDSDKVHYALSFNNLVHHLELEPNYDFMSPSLIIERRREARDLSGVDLSAPRDQQCHYHGKVRGHKGSRVALSMCDGLAGHITTSDGHFFVEPAHNVSPGEDGRHLHLVHKHARDEFSRSHGHPTSKCQVDDDWQSAWAKRLRYEYNNGSSWSGQFKRSSSEHRYVEVCVVADKMFVDHYKGTDKEAYILTIMNMVSDYYHDASVGNMVDVVVVRIIMLERERSEVDLTISRNGEKTLQSFAAWAKRTNPTSLNHPNHHDIAVLLTRHDICSENMTQCGLLGLAYVAAACNPDMAACINEDGGLVLSVTVSHEIGHVMGCSHDTEQISGCKPEALDGSSHVMSPYVRSYTTVWSACSRRFITEFLDNGLGECLLDEPQDQLFKLPKLPAGAMYDANYQCRSLFGPNSAACSSKVDCKTLWCVSKPNSCGSFGDPPEDGTKCGPNKWCYNLQCVTMGQRPGSVNGGWGPWGAWTPCSRTCGAGVSSKERQCDNPTPKHLGRYCIGKRKQYRTCNTVACPLTATPFRELQCTERNSKPFNGKRYRWKPYKKEGGNPCSLTCINEERIFAVLSPRVKDGTPCKPGTRDLCAGGDCKHVGCDWQLESGAEFDNCGICRGDGTQCDFIQGIYTKNGHGYVKVVTIPKGAHNVRVKELRASTNTIAISSKRGKTFYLNGQNKEEADGQYIFGKSTLGIYSHPEKEREELLIFGPTEEDLNLHVVFYSQAKYPGMRYEYYKKKKGREASTNPKYNWEFVEWEQCSVRCGGGTQVSLPICVEDTGGKVSNSFCQEIPKPEPETRVCNDDPCQCRWVAGEWSECISGKRIRDVRCMMESPHEEDDDIEETQDRCNSTKPDSSEDCTVTDNGTVECSKPNATRMNCTTNSTTPSSQQTSTQSGCQQTSTQSGCQQTSTQSGCQQTSTQSGSQQTSTQSDWQQTLTSPCPQRTSMPPPCAKPTSSTQSKSNDPINELTSQVLSMVQQLSNSGVKAPAVASERENQKGPAGCTKQQSAAEEDKDNRPNSAVHENQSIDIKQEKDCQELSNILGKHPSDFKDEKDGQNKYDIFDKHHSDLKEEKDGQSMSDILEKHHSDLKDEKDDQHKCDIFVKHRSDLKEEKDGLPKYDILEKHHSDLKEDKDGQQKYDIFEKHHSDLKDERDGQQKYDILERHRSDLKEDKDNQQKYDTLEKQHSDLREEKDDQQQWGILEKQHSDLNEEKDRQHKYDILEKQHSDFKDEKNGQQMFDFLEKQHSNLKDEKDGRRLMSDIFGKQHLDFKEDKNSQPMLAMPEMPHSDCNDHKYGLGLVIDGDKPVVNNINEVTEIKQLLLDSLNTLPTGLSGDKYHVRWWMDGENNPTKPKKENTNLFALDGGKTRPMDINDDKIHLLLAGEETLHSDLNPGKGDLSSKLRGTHPMLSVPGQATFTDAIQFPYNIEEGKDNHNSLTGGEKKVTAWKQEWDDVNNCFTGSGQYHKNSKKESGKPNSLTRKQKHAIGSKQAKGHTKSLTRREKYHRVSKEGKGNKNALIGLEDHDIGFKHEMYNLNTLTENNKYDTHSKKATGKKHSSTRGGQHNEDLKTFNHHEAGGGEFNANLKTFNHHKSASGEHDADLKTFNRHEAGGGEFNADLKTFNRHKSASGEHDADFKTFNRHEAGGGEFNADLNTFNHHKSASGEHDADLKTFNRHEAGGGELNADLKTFNHHESASGEHDVDLKTFNNQEAGGGEHDADLKTFNRHQVGGGEHDANLKTVKSHEEMTNEGNTKRRHSKGREYKQGSSIGNKHYHTGLKGGKHHIKEKGDRGKYHVDLKYPEEVTIKDKAHPVVLKDDNDIQENQQKQKQQHILPWQKTERKDIPTFPDEIDRKLTTSKKKHKHKHSRKGKKRHHHRKKKNKHSKKHHKGSKKYFNSPAELTEINDEHHSREIRTDPLFGVHGEGENGSDIDDENDNEEDLEVTQKPCGSSNKTDHKMKMNEAVEDRIPLSNVTLIEVPLLEKNTTKVGCNNTKVFSDEAEEEMGDEANVMLDTGNEKVYHGQEAVDKIRTIEKEKKKEEPVADSRKKERMT